VRYRSFALPAIIENAKRSSNILRAYNQEDSRHKHFAQKETIMTDDELRTLVADLVLSTRDLRATVESHERIITEGFASQAASTRELRITIESQSESIKELRTTAERQEQITIEGLASLRAASESQLSAIENQRESIGHNAQMMADAMEMAAISQQMAAKSQEIASQCQETAAIALRVSAETTRNIARSEQILGIVIRDAQADRARFSKLEGQS
jgi:hypothetical protein